MQMQFDIKNWVALEDGVAVEFRGRKPRPVTLEFNSAGKAAIYLQLASEKAPRLLALVEGRERVKFAVDGPFSIVKKTADVDCYLFTRDGNEVHRVALDEEAYTTLHEPQPRDANLERIMERMQRSVNLRLAQQQAQQEAMYERMLADERRRLAADQPAADAPTGAGEQQAGGDSDAAPSAPPSAEDGAAGGGAG